MPELAEAALPELTTGAETVSHVVEEPGTGADAGGDSASPDTGAESAQPGQSTSETGETVEPGAEEAQAQEDGRTVPADIRKHFAELKATNPALAKKLKAVFFAEREFRSHFPNGPQEAVKLKEFVDTVGGEEGYQGLQDTLKGWEELDGLYSNGDKGFVDRISKSDPEAFGQMMPHAFEKWAELDKAGYDHLLSRVIINTLNSSPIAEIYRLLGSDEKTKALAEKLGQWYGGIDELAQKVPQKQVDPERQKFERERQEWETQKQNEFRDSVGKEMQSFYVQNIESAISAEFKTRNRSFSQLKSSNEDAYWMMVNDTYNRIRQSLSSDKAFIGKFESLLQRGDGAAAKKLAQSRAQRIIAEAAKKTYSAFNVGSGTATAQAKTTAQTQQQRANAPPTTKLNTQPQPEQIDWGRTDPGMVLDGKAYLKGRKELVTF